MQSADPTTLGPLIREYRVCHGWNQTELGRKFGVTAATICNWEQNKPPASEHVPTLAETLRMTPRRVFRLREQLIGAA